MSSLDLPAIICLSAVSLLLPLAHVVSATIIPAARRLDRLLVLWHAYDALTHILVEGSYLYHCFFSYTSVDPTSSPGPWFLNQPDRRYGAAHGSGGTARLWQEYGKADARWAGADVGVIALELLTVFIGGSVAVWICWLVYASGGSSSSSTRARGTMWLVIAGLAVAELYGGWMTFAPEWLSGSTALATDDPVYLWVYLVFFNGLWVVVPVLLLGKAWSEIAAVFGQGQADDRKRA